MWPITTFGLLDGTINCIYNLANLYKIFMPNISSILFQGQNLEPQQNSDDQSINLGPNGGNSLFKIHCHPLLARWHY